MQKESNIRIQADERGATNIKPMLMLAVVAIIIFLGIKIAPVYFQERQVIYDTDELARTVVTRSMGETKIAEEVKRLAARYDLQPESFTVSNSNKEKITIRVNYTVPIDLLLTTYSWQVDHLSTGQAF